MTPESIDRELTVAATAVVLEVTESVVREWIAAGTLPARQVPSGKHLVSSHAVRERLLAPYRTQRDTAQQTAEEWFAKATRLARENQELRGTSTS